MDDIIGLVLLFGMLFGLEVVAIFILVMSALYGRQLVFVILCGIVAAVVMAAESFNIVHLLCHRLFRPSRERDAHNC
jgi:fatty acid desaturase